MLDWILTHTPIIYFTQSLWRDEVFSIFVAERSISFFINKMSFETPLYYVILHFIIKIFGTNETVLRLSSFLVFVAATVIIIFWSEKLFKKHWLSWFLPIIFFLNPMLLYYSFEIRTYSWYIFFAVLSSFAYLEKRWKLLLIVNVLGFYIHSYFVFIPFIQVLHWSIFNFRKIKHPTQLLKESMVKTNIGIFLLIAPWLLKILSEASKLKQSWYFPVDAHLIKSVLGNLFLGYEGTPWYVWKFTSLLSIMFIVVFILAIRHSTNRKRNLYFILSVFVPLILVIGVSFLKPLYVNRYVIPVTIAEVFLIAFAIESMSKPVIQKVTAICVFGFLIIFNMWYPNKHMKLNIRSVVQEINIIKKPEDIVLAESPLIFFESIYYSTNKNNVSLYNPNNVGFPWYVGDLVVSPSQMTQEFPIYPKKAFLIHENGSYDIIYKTPPSTSQTNSRNIPL